MDSFSNRIAKNFRHLRKWARREEIENFRIYDHDIPEVPCVIELYSVYPKPSDFATPETQLVIYWDLSILREDREGLATPEEVESTLQEAALKGLSEIEIDKIIFKKRGQRAGGTRALGALSESLNIQDRGWVREDDLFLEINLTSHHDSGLFLDHRRTRRIVRVQSENLRVLNLFGYTGSFSVHAFAGEAKAVTTVDLSQTYLDWALRNFVANRFQTNRCYFVRADILDWLDLAIQFEQQFGIIVCDPPTFSNSKKMRQTFQVQEQQEFLLSKCVQLLEPGGILYFSTNSQRFRFAEGFSERHPELESCMEISSETVSEDFRKTKSGHRCWRIVKK